MNPFDRPAILGLIAVAAVMTASPARCDISEFASALAAIPSTARIGAVEQGFIDRGARGWYKWRAYRDYGPQRYYNRYMPQFQVPPDGTVDMMLEYEPARRDRVFKRISISFHHPDMIAGGWISRAILQGVDFKSERGQRRTLSALSFWLPTGFRASSASKKTMRDGFVRYSSGGAKGAIVDFLTNPPAVQIDLMHPSLVELERPRAPAPSRKRSEAPAPAPTSPAATPVPAAPLSSPPEPDWLVDDDTLKAMQRRPNGSRPTGPASSVRPIVPGMNFPSDSSDYGPSAPAPSTSLDQAPVGP